MHFGVIQRNTILSCTRFQPKPEILLSGNEDGVAALANEAGVRLAKQREHDC